MSSKRFQPSQRIRLTVKKIPWRPLGGLLGPAVTDARQSLLALGFAAITSLITGLTLASVSGLFREHPGLLLLLPAAIGLRGNVFGPLGSRLSTAIQAGTFSWSRRLDSLLGENVLAALSISFLASLGVAVLAKVVSSLYLGGSSAVIGLDDFIVISVTGAMVASIVVLAITLGLAVLSVRFGWDLDNVTAPIVSASGDFVTLPALLLGVYFSNRGMVTVSIAGVFVVLGVVVIALLFFSTLEKTCGICKESLPVLLMAATLSLIAGIILEGSKGRFEVYPVLLIILPGYLAIAGALGGILSNRLATKVHLGLISASAWPSANARKDIGLTYKLALPIFLFLACLAHSMGRIAAVSSPGFLLLGVVALTGGMLATIFVAIVAYYSTLIVVKFGLDPDNHGIPIVSASLDLVGVSTLTGALTLWGVV